MIHSIDPIAFHLFNIPIYWYGLAYATAFLLGAKYLVWLFKKSPETGFTPQKVDGALTGMMIGIILGGRLGYVLFYNPAYFLENPLEIFMLWTGGMSFHGGMIGVIFASIFFCKKNKLSFWNLIDHMAPTACIGLFLGRIANFINGELYGHITTVPWGVIFPNAGPDPRHPSQLYEAFFEGIALFVILHIIALKKPHKGILSGVFLSGYGLSRFAIESVRMRDAHLSEGLFVYISMGQILCIPMIIGGILLLAYHQRIKG